MSMILCRMWIMAGGHYSRAGLLLKRNAVNVINWKKLLIQIVDNNRTTTYCYCAERIFCICQNWQTLLRRLNCPKSWQMRADSAQCGQQRIAAHPTTGKRIRGESRENTWDREILIEIFLTGAIKNLYTCQIICIYSNADRTAELNIFILDRLKGRKCEKSRQIVA